MYDPEDYVFQEDFRKQKNLTFRSKKHFDALISNPEKRRIYKKDVDISRVPLIFHSRGYGHGFYDLPRNDMELLDWLEESRWSLRPVVDKSGRLEIYYIEVDADKVTVEECLELLKRIDLCESRFIACSVKEPSLFYADLNKSDVTRLEASNGISRVYPRGRRLRVEDAFEVFEGGEGEICDCISYNAMIAGLAGAGRDVEALLMFKDMQKVHLRPTELTFVGVMGLCSCARIAIQVHAQAIKIGYENCTSVRNAAMTMYSTCGELDTAHMVFREMQEKDTVSWNTIITGYAQGHLAGAAILAYLQMQSEGIRPDEFTVGSLLASTEMLVSVEMILAVVFKYGLFSNTQVSNALLSAFSKYGEIKQAYEVFNGMCHRSLISWNSLISELQLNGFLVEGLVEFSELLKSEMSPNAYSFSIALSICASISALGHGKQIHGYILKNGYFQQTSLGNTLITLYAKSGDLDRSVKVFNAMNEKDIISWNSMISAYAQHGEGMEAARCFQVMQDSAGNEATFTAVLSACSHAGLVDNVIHIFNSMVNKYGFEPGVDHFSCIVDLLGRAGHLDVAERLITTKLIDMDSNIWWTLFSSCAAHGNLRLGRIIAECLLKKEHNNPTVWINS
ncbi:Pentatricopeptide repeat-containing protein [Heracleum sosnowskyi]|uniref:Pentatricopeptide repeat-containing protein n=1 Tax=Heracleum sosnowskyi TaxID=360622 RepID=A0AAD8H2N6_9APIA|nr:Pentatricopeptide repeat-containing protein [Heracleum sosnowskyi]